MLLSFAFHGSSQSNYLFMVIYFFLLSFLVTGVLHLSTAWLGVFFSLTLCCLRIDMHFEYLDIRFSFVLESSLSLTLLMFCLHHSVSHLFLEFQFDVCEVFSLYHLCLNVSSYFLPLYISVLHSNFQYYLPVH